MIRVKLISCLLIVGLALFSCIVPAPAQEPAQAQERKSSGLFLGGEVGALIGFGDGATLGAPGKVDFLVGYQVNPYFSVGADLWTFWFIAYAAEAHLKANFTDSKISPYAVGTAGVVGVITTLDEDEGGGAAFTYSAGLGADFNLWKRATLFTEARYRGATGWEDSPSAHGLEAGVGLRWRF
jgi:hypothetical protein